jgi:putative transposase
MRYIEQNPVRAKLVKRAEDYQWSSARAHISGIKGVKHFRVRLAY